MAWTAVSAMTDARAEMLDRVRRALKRGALDPAATQAVERRIASHQPGPIPKRTDLDREGLPIATVEE